MAYTTTTMLSFLPPVIDFVGDPVKAAGYYGPTRGIHTFSIKTINFMGRVIIEGSLLASPADQDWFPILLDGVNSSFSFPMLNWNRPVGGWQAPSWEGQTGCFGYTVVVNCVLLRARMMRSNIIPLGTSEYAIATFGSIDNIRVRF